MSALSAEWKRVVVPTLVVITAMWITNATVTVRLYGVRTTTSSLIYIANTDTAIVGFDGIVTLPEMAWMTPALE